MIDREARRQLLSARIALERMEVARDVERARDALRLPPLLRALVAPLTRTGDAGDSRKLRIAQTAFTLLRRYPMLVSGLSLATPLLGGRAWLRRLVLVATLAGGAYAAWRGSQPAAVTPPASPPAPR